MIQTYSNMQCRIQWFLPSWLYELNMLSRMFYLVSSLLTLYALCCTMNARENASKIYIYIYLPYTYVNDMLSTKHDNGRSNPVAKSDLCSTSQTYLLCYLHVGPCSTWLLFNKRAFNPGRTILMNELPACVKLSCLVACPHLF